MILPFRFFAESACQQKLGIGCDPNNTGLPNVLATAGRLQSLLQVLFAILGALAVLMMIIGALNFVHSEGDSQKAASARNTMVYSLIGLVIAISAEIIVGFVLGRF